MSLDADVSFANAKFLGVEPGQSHIPGAIESVVAGGIAWSPASDGVFGALRVRHFGGYPLIEDNSVRAHPSTLVSADAGYQLASGTRLQVSLLNLLNGNAEDIQYYYASRLRGEPLTGVDGIHSHPVEPRQVRVSIQHDFR